MEWYDWSRGVLEQCWMDGEFKSWYPILLGRTQTGRLVRILTTSLEFRFRSTLLKEKNKNQKIYSESISKGIYSDFGSKIFEFSNVAVDRGWSTTSPDTLRWSPLFSALSPLSPHRTGSCYGQCLACWLCWDLVHGYCHEQDRTESSDTCVYNQNCKS